MVQGVSGNKRFLVRFHSGCKNDTTSNQLTFETVEKSTVKEEPGVVMIHVIPDETVTSEK